MGRPRVDREFPVTVIPDDIIELTTLPTERDNVHGPHTYRLTPEKCQKLVNLILQGSTRTNACWRVGLSPKTVTITLSVAHASLQTKKEDEELNFVEKFTIAVYAAQAFYVDTMMGKAMSAVDRMAMAWPAVFRRFESEYPEEWTQKQEVTQTTNINQKIEYVVTRVDANQRRAIEATPNEGEDIIESSYVEVEDF